MAIPISTSRSHIYQSITTSRAQSDDLQRQLATGLKAETYGDLGLERRRVIEFNGDISQLQGYVRSIEQATVRVDILDETLTQIWNSVTTTRTDSLSTNFDLNSDGQTLFQSEALARFQDVASILNTEAGGRYIYSGAEVTTKPVEPPQVILDGQGAQAGFKQVAAERQLADLGTDLKGRVTLSQPSATEVRLAEDGSHPFGFKIAGLNSTVTGLTATGPTGTPSQVDFSFAANTAQDGETITIALTLPDGTSTDLKLTARSGAPEHPGEFQIGATATDTATNLNAAIDAELLRLGDTELRAASQFEASDNFFNFDEANPPQRVAGPPYDTATALVDATTADTVFWYQGELSSSDARSSQTVKVDDYISVDYGVRANEEAFRNALQNLAVASLDTYTVGDQNGQDRYNAVRGRVTENLSLSAGKQGVDAIIADIAGAESVIGRTKERHQTHSNLLQTMVDDVQNADIYEVSSKLLDLQTRLQATYQTIGTLQGISLVNFI